MTTHVKVLAVLFLAFSALGLAAGLFTIFALGGTAAIVGATASPEDAAIAVPILGLIGTMFAVVALVLSVPGILAGWGLLSFKPWARILGIILAAIQLINLSAFPISTAFGAYALWVLLTKETERLFNPVVSTP